MPRTLDKTVMVRDRYLVLLMFRHGLRISEACGVWTLHHTPSARRRDPCHQGLAGRAGTDEGLGRSFFLSEQRKPLHCSTVNLLLHKYG